jgi:hypothetical protein
LKPEYLEKDRTIKHLSAALSLVPDRPGGSAWMPVIPWASSSAPLMLVSYTNRSAVVNRKTGAFAATIVLDKTVLPGQHIGVAKTVYRG